MSINLYNVEREQRIVLVILDFGTRLFKSSLIVSSLFCNFPGDLEPFGLPRVFPASFNLFKDFLVFIDVFLAFDIFFQISFPFDTTLFFKKLF